MPEPVRLYAIPKPYRDPLAIALDAPAAGGLIETADRHLARQALERGVVALVDPPDAEGVMLAYRLMQRRDGGLYTGPPIYFDPAAFRAPTIPAGGMSISDTLAGYLGGAPVPLKLRPGRLQVRGLSAPLAPLWRRTVAAPAGLSYPRHPEHLEPLLRFEAALRTLPPPAALADWYQRVRTAQWGRIALHRFVADVLAGDIVGGAPDGGCPVPESFFASDTTLNPDTGDLYGAHDSRVPLVAGVRMFARGEVPAAAAMTPIARFRASVAEAGELLGAHRGALALLPRHRQVAFLRAHLPQITISRANQLLIRTIGRSRTGPRRAAG